MADKGKLAEQAARAAHAEHLKSDPLLQEFFDKAESAAVEAWKMTTPDQAEARERAWYAYDALQALKLCFTKTLSDGKLATAELLRLKSKANDKENDT